MAGKPGGKKMSKTTIQIDMDENLTLEELERFRLDLEEMLKSSDYGSSVTDIKVSPKREEV